MVENIHVWFVDGVTVGIPVEARFISENTYQILSDSEFDYEDDAILFEFGPQDVVRVRSQQLETGSSALAAYELVEAGDERNLQKRLMFHILMYQPAPRDLFDGISDSDI